MATFVRGITPKRAVALYHLNVNPDGLRRIEGELEDYAHNVCAAGLACHALDIRMKNKRYSDPDPEQALADMLEMPYSHVRAIFRLNDSYKLSFNQVGNVLEDYFNQELSGSAVSARSPESIYLDDTEKYKEVEGEF